jgi:hypothetical protein
LTVRARTIIHPEPGTSVPVYLGEAKRSLVSRKTSAIAVEIYTDKFAQLPKPNA